MCLYKINKQGKLAQTQIHIIYLHVSFRVNHHNLKLNEAQNQQIFYAEFLILCRINKKGLHISLKENCHTLKQNEAQSTCAESTSKQVNKHS